MAVSLPADTPIRALPNRHGIRQRFGKLGEPGSVAITERAILTLKQEWLGPLPILRGADHLEQLLSDFAIYYKEYRGHTTLAGAVPDAVHTGQHWQRPERSAKVLPIRLERRRFAEVRVTAFRLAAWNRGLSVARQAPAVFRNT